jgi:hypothetical protein
MDEMEEGYMDRMKKEWIAWKNVTVNSSNGNSILIKDIFGEVKGR